MRICRTKAELRAARTDLGLRGARIGLVPTMGYLHDGHLSLIRAARAETDRVIATIFVNPTQFGPTEDLASYPRDTDRDLALLRAENVDAVFLPEPGEMYAEDAETVVETTELAGVLIGALRPGHFRGVATVVTKLFNLTRPDRAYFGQKDYQQLCVIRRMVRDLDIGVEVRGMPTRRECDGLALSSRNVRLTAAARAQAPALYRALLAGQAALEAGRGVAAAQDAIRAALADADLALVRSVDIRDAQSLAQVPDRPDAPVVILLAVAFGDVLLIDNLVATPKRPA
ncbi:pantoate--beta-alanine ligase [Palleronia rufa]|uniref:pantoate--beta-alanine ligase n=1 Tax=Palleronia rufa TaxID=1530186 RepID=UPI00055A0EA3|nr:pantoate--beta-alanine ligase [Palleronia rufa]